MMASKKDLENFLSSQFLQKPKLIKFFYKTIFQAVFTRTTKYLEWINGYLGDEPTQPPPATTTTIEPPTDDRCNCVCNCYTCPANPPRDEL